MQHRAAVDERFQYLVPHLIAAILTFHTPQTAEQMRELLAEQRSETLRRALATIDEQT
jgi:hypothetical protein